MVRLTKKDYKKIKEFKDANIYRYGLRTVRFPSLNLQPHALFCDQVARLMPKGKKENARRYCVRMWDKWVAGVYA